MKLYTEEQVRKAIELAQECDHDGYYPVNFDYSKTQILGQLTPIELPSDEEISEEADSFFALESYNQTFTRGAKWMRDKIQGEK